MSADIVERLLAWDVVYPQDLDKPEGHLYVEAAIEITGLSSELLFSRVANIIMVFICLFFFSLSGFS